MAWYEDSAKKTQVREYASRKHFERESAKASEYRWSVSTVSEMTQRAGCLRGCTLGLFALVWKPKSHILVTYTHP